MDNINQTIDELQAAMFNMYVVGRIDVIKSIIEVVNSSVKSQAGTELEEAVIPVAHLVEFLTKQLVHEEATTKETPNISINVKE